MKVKRVTDNQGRFIGIRFDCPGCKYFHLLPVLPVPAGMEKSPHYVVGVQAHWHFNGDYDNPTLSPSIHERTGHFAGGTGEDCWCVMNQLDPPTPGEKVWECANCHFFLRDGEIEFLPDCSHSLAGQKVLLPEIETPQDKAA